MKILYFKSLKYILALFLIVTMILPAAVSADSSDDSSTSNVEISCTYPGKIIEAGETITFNLDITNNQGTDPKKIRLDTFKGEEDWKFHIYAGDYEIDRLAMKKGQEVSVTLEIETTGDTAVDTYPVRVAIDDASIWLYVIVDETHKDEMGVLVAEVVDDQGEPIDEACINVYKHNTDKFITSVYTTSDGQIRTEIDQGDYDLLVEREGYRSREVKDVSINCGYTEDIGTVMLEKKTYGLLIDFKSPIVTTTSDDNPTFEAVITNIGKSDDVIKLGTEGAPDKWYFKFKENADSSESISSIYLDSGDQKTIYVEAIPPNSVETGEYSFNATFESSDYLYEEGLTAGISGTSNMVVFSEKYKYEITKGDTVEIPVQITNNGNGEALTNVQTEVTTPDGWSVQVSPEEIASIEAGDKETVVLTVVPPANIAASEYKISLNVVSDEEEESDDIRIIIKENSYVGILGILLLVAVIGGVIYFFRKHARR